MRRDGRVETPAEPGPTEPGWWVAVRRMAGGLQSLYAVAFGRWALDALAHCHHPAFQGKGLDAPASLSLGELALGFDLALLSGFGLVGGAGLLAGRPWARRWEAAYLLALTGLVIAVVAATATDPHFGSSPFASIALIAMAFALPALPFAFRARSGGAIAMSQPGWRGPGAVGP